MSIDTSLYCSNSGDHTASYAPDGVGSRKSPCTCVTNGKTVYYYCRSFNNMSMSVYQSTLRHLIKTPVSCFPVCQVVNRQTAAFQCTTIKALLDVTVAMATLPLTCIIQITNVVLIVDNIYMFLFFPLSLSLSLSLFLQVIRY